MKWLTTLAIAALACLPAYPQAQSNAGEIRGSVADASGSAIRGAKLQALDPNRAIQRSAVSNEEGEFVLPVLPPGRYRVRVEAAGFAAQVLAQFRCDLLGLLVGNEAEVHLGAGPVRQHGLRTRSDVAGVQAADRARGTEQLVLD